MKSPTQHNFSQIPAPRIERSMLPRNHSHKLTFNSGALIPFFLDDVLPGDTLHLKANLFARLSTLQFPIMDNVYLDTFYFFVPNRLIWENWEKFNGAQDNPGDSTDFLIPQCGGDPLEFGEGTLGDYFGLPTQVTIADGDDQPTSLPFRAYELIWNEWFRDENLQDTIIVPMGDGPDSYHTTLPLPRGKRHDYFTSALPWPQKGDSVMLPLGTSAPIIGTGRAFGLWDGTTQYGLRTDGSGFLRASVPFQDAVVGASPATTLNSSNLALGVTTNAFSGMQADLSAASAATVNQLRQAFAFQSILEKDARGGTRYTELLRAHFGVVSPDFRLQRPEYLGGSSQHIDVRAIAQTSGTPAAGTPQANLSAYAAVGSVSGFNKSFVEHGWVMGIVNVRSDISYQQGMARMWNRRTRFDFYLPSLAHLGEQAVLNRELFYADLGVGAQNVFGYQERWAEYKYKPSQVSGAFRSNAAQSLDVWHLATDFGSQPPLNGAFIEDAPPLDRVIAVSEAEGPQILMDSYISMRHARPMPVYSIPGLLGRF